MKHYTTPPANQGQIVEVSYLCTPTMLIERTFDRSDRTTTYRRALWTQKLERWAESVGPHEAPPPSKTRWARLSPKDAELAERLASVEVTL